MFYCYLNDGMKCCKKGKTDKYVIFVDIRNQLILVITFTHTGYSFFALVLYHYFHTNKSSRRS
ncbi:hypothetical protein BD408DRAFT_420493 [Parasitella parasitica]|nr:hypothetical protein BD408DRAFT_420493 [Parasitella parasitica]